MRLIAVVGMTREARIIAGAGVTTVIGGGDSAGLAERLAAVIAGWSGPPPSLVLSFGVCGALAPDLAAGDLILAESVIQGAELWRTDAAWTARLARALPQARRAPIAAGDAMIASAEAKAALHAASGAAAVDMESHITARLAAEHALPFAAIRAVSDRADHALPPAALAGLGPDGTPDIAAVLWALARRPGQLPALVRTAREAEAGFRALKAAAGAWRG